MSDPEAADQRPRQRIYDARESMHEARLALKTENMAGSPSMDTRRRFCAVLSAYYDVLKEHRDDPALEPTWAERGVDWIDRWVQHDVTQKIEPRGTGYGTRTREVSETVTMPTEISREAFRATNSFLADVGLDLTQDDGRPTFGTAPDRP